MAAKQKPRVIKQRFGIVVNHKRVARVCKKYGFLAKNRRRKFSKDYYKQQKEQKKGLPKNILARDFVADLPNKKLCTNVSYFRTKGGWLYFSPVMDLHSRKITAYPISEKSDMNMVFQMLDSLFSKNELQGAILHSDQGSLYTAPIYRQRLKDKNITQSMSRRGNCWDGACIEHFFGTLKVESGYDDLLKANKLLSFDKTKALTREFC